MHHETPDWFDFGRWLVPVDRPSPGLAADEAAVLKRVARSRRKAQTRRQQGGDRRRPAGSPGTDADVKLLASLADLQDVKLWAPGSATRASGNLPQFPNSSRWSWTTPEITDAGMAVLEEAAATEVAQSSPQHVPDRRRPARTSRTPQSPVPVAAVQQFLRRRHGRTEGPHQAPAVGPSRLHRDRRRRPGATRRD